MEGLEISVLNLSEVLFDNTSKRIDSEYFKKEYLEIDANIETKDYLRLKDLSEKITDFGAFSQNNFIKYREKGNFHFIRNQDIENSFIKNKKIFIDKEVYEKLSLKLEEFDILLQRTGSIGKSGLVLKKDLPSSANQNLAQVKPDKNKINPYFLNTFLNSSIGQKTFERLATGNVQPWLNLGQIESIKVPLLSEKVQILIENLVKKAYNNISISKQTYTQAENLLLEEIGLQNFTPSKESVNIKSYKASFGTSGRLDAEYYQVKYDSYEEQIRKSVENVILINEVLSEPIKNGTTPKKVIRTNGNINFVRVEAFGNNLDFNDKNCFSVTDDTYNKYTHNRIIKNDILVSMTGTIGNVSIYNSKNNGLINQNLVKLTANTKVVLVNYLAFYIKIVGKIFLMKLQTGNVQPYVNISNFSNLIVPIIDYKKQQQIANLIEQSFSLKKQSEHLLEVAKRAVEIAIEENETIALKYINQETK